MPTLKARKPLKVAGPSKSASRNADLRTAVDADGQAARVLGRRGNRDALLRHQLHQQLLGFRMRDRGLHADTHQPAGPIQRNEGFIHQGSVDRVAAAAVVHVHLGSVIHQCLDHLGIALVRGAVQRGAAFVVLDVGVDPQVQAQLDRLQALLFRPFIPNSDIDFIYQVSTSIDMAAAPGLQDTWTKSSNTVQGAIGLGDTFIGLQNHSLGRLKFGEMYMLYKTSTDRLNPFGSGLGNYAVIMGNTGGDNRVEFGTRSGRCDREQLAHLGGGSASMPPGPSASRSTITAI